MSLLSTFETLGRTLAGFGVPAGKLGNVVVVPGILGCNLVDGAEESLWMVPPRLDKLALNPDGASESDPARTVRPTDANWIYLPMIHILEASWKVLTFTYDWRKSVVQSAEDLAAAVKASFPGEDFHIVAHSQGGMIARVMLGNSPGIQRTGRFVMLGTPNYGSVLTRKILTGETNVASAFGSLQITVDSLELATARTWPSAYQLLPSPVMDPASQPIYDNPPPGFSPTHVAGAAKMYADLDAVPFGDSMFYIAGNNVPTIDGGDVPTLSGDGIVSHRLGIPKGVRTFKVPNNHFGLPSDPSVLGSITPLLHNGNAALLNFLG